MEKISKDGRTERAASRQAKSRLGPVVHWRPYARVAQASGRRRRRRTAELGALRGGGVGGDFRVAGREAPAEQVDGPRLRALRGGGRVLFEAWRGWE